MARWSEKQVVDLAPDAASATAARRLAVAGPWSEAGSTDVLVWGRCQGSGRTPYQVSVDLAGPAYRCSCPSRKIPCKHVLALLLLWSRDALDGSAEAGGDVAAAAAEWAVARAGAEAARATRVERPVDPEARARRAEERVARMDAGVDDLRLWLRDVVRSGLAQTRVHPASWWDDTAARLVDAQLPGLADRLRDLGSAVHARGDWTDHLLGEIGRLWTLTCVWQRRDALPPDDLADLRVAVGWSQSVAEVREGGGRPGPWLVLGAHRTDDGRLRQQRTWLRHDDGEIVQVLDFAAAGQPLAVPQLGGSVIEASVATFPGHPPRRGVFADEPVAIGPASGLEGGVGVREVLAGTAAALAHAPWRDLAPIVLAPVRVAPADDGRPAAVHDDAGDAIPLADDTAVWPLLAATGGAPAAVFGELEAGRLRPLSVAVDHAVVAL